MPAWLGAYRSIFGRKFGHTSTGGLASADSSANVQLWGSGMNVNSTATLPLITNSGVSFLSAGSATSVVATIAAPVVGVLKEIYANCSASALTIGGTSTSVLFMKAGGGINGSTVISMIDPGGVAGRGLMLRGVSTATYAVIGNSTTFTF